MKAKTSLILLILIAGLVLKAHADTYSTFQTTRYYSANRRFFVVVNENKRATLYRNGRKLTYVWRSILADLPNQLFVTDDGKRVAIVGRYYGDAGLPWIPVIFFLDEKGEQFAVHLLGDLANLKRVPQTISNAHWYEDARLSDDKQSLLIRTVILKYEDSYCKEETSSEQAEKCREIVPFQELRFALMTGELVRRKRLASQ